MQDTKIEVRESTFEGLADRWDKMLRACREATVFLTPTWQRIWWSRFGKGARLHLLEFWQADSPVAIAPLMSRDGVVSFLGDTDLVDYHDLIVSHADSSAVAGALADHLASLSEWHTLDLKSIPGDSPTLPALKEAVVRTSLKPEDRIEDLAPGVALPDSFDGYLAGLDKKDRHELRRKLRRLHGAGKVEQKELKTPKEMAGAFEDFIRLVRQSSPEKDQFLTPERLAFMQEVTLALASADQARMFLMSLDGKRVAGSLCFRYGGKYFGYNSGYDPEYRSLAVGLLNHALSLERVISQGARYFDFMRGDERYKYDLGAKDREIHHVVVRR